MTTSSDVKTEPTIISETFYTPPGNQFDVKRADTEFYKAWQKTMLTMFWSAMWRTPQKVVYRLPDYQSIADDVNTSAPSPANKQSYLQFRPTHELYLLGNKLIRKKLVWTGFPKQMKTQFPQALDAYKNAERIRNGVRVYMDEYCEWFTYNKAGVITKIVITCEGPEYWHFLFETRPQTCLALYHKYVSPDVQMKDLTNANGSYNASNKWNSIQGIMHLNCPPNSLSAEVYLAAESAAYWLRNNGTIITDPQELIEAAQYGSATRASDPSIGAAVNELVRSNFVVSLENPIGIYMEKLNTGGWQKPGNAGSFSKSELSSIISYDRGNAESERYLRITIEIPSDAGYVLGECKIAGVPILYAGQLVDASVTVFLVGLAVDGTVLLKKDAKEGKGGIKAKITWDDSFPPYKGQPLVTNETAVGIVPVQKSGIIVEEKKNVNISKIANIHQRLADEFTQYRYS